MNLDTILCHTEGAVLFAEIIAPPMNLLGPELVRDLVTLIQRAEADRTVRVVVFKSLDPDYFIAHVDVTRILELREEAAKLAEDSSVGLLFRYLSASRLVTIAQIAGRVRGVGSEFALACDMRFAARSAAVFCQFEAAFGVIPGAGGVQFLVRQIGRARALEVMLSTQDYDADSAERLGWINRSVPDEALDSTVRRLAQRIAAVPAAGLEAVKQRVNAFALPPAEEFRTDSNLFIHGLRQSCAQHRLKLALERGFQTREAEMNLPHLLRDLS